MATIYVINGWCPRRYFDGRDRDWLVPFCFYDTEQAQAHIRETVQEIKRIWPTIDTEVEWDTRAPDSWWWRPIYSEEEFWPHKLADLDPHLIGFEDFSAYNSLPVYSVVALQTRGPP